MKKKAFLAILAMCAMFAAAGCGTQKNDKADVQKEQTADNGKADKENKDDKADKEDKGSKDDTAKPSSFGSRLVSVDNVEKYVTIGDYKGLTLDNKVQDVSQDEIDARIETELQEKAAEVTAKDAAVENGDLVTINYVGTKDGVAFDGGTANNYDLTIGSGRLIDGFEDGIIGMKTGETKDLNLTFPEEYPSTELAGQKVVFKVTLQKFRRAEKLEDIDDKWVAKNTEYTTLEDYRAGVKKKLEEEAKASADNTLKASAWSTVLANSEVKEYPQEDIDNAIAEYKTLIENYAKQGDMDLKTFVESQGVSMEDFDAQCQQYAELKIKQNLIVQGIMDAEGMTLDDKECLAVQEQLIKDYSAKDITDLVSRYGQAAVNESIGIVRVEDFIVENAIVSEKIADGDMVGENGNAGEDMAEEPEIVDEGTEEE